MCVCVCMKMSQHLFLIEEWQLLHPVNVKILRREHWQHSVVDVLIKVACLVKK